MRDGSKEQTVFGFEGFKKNELMSPAIAGLFLLYFSFIELFRLYELYRRYVYKCVKINNIRMVIQKVI